MKILANQEQGRPLLEIVCFGGLEIRLNQKLITTLVSRKANGLVAYLTCCPQIHQREVLADFLWDDRTQQQALGNLRVVLNSLRRDLPSFVAITRQTVQLARTKQVWADTTEFDYLVAPALHSMPLTAEKIANLQRALELYKGDFLAGFFLRDAHLYDEWVSFERERYLICAVRTAQIVANHYLATNNYAQGLGVAQRWVQLDPLNEIAHQTLMELLVSSGQRTAALEHYQRHLHKTASEGIELTGEFEAFYQRLSRDELATAIEALQVCVAPAVAPIAAVPHNLPASLTPLVGRQDELFQIQHRLEDPTCRLLTITGMGGAGKTRLALEVGQLISRSLSGVNLFRDGVYLVRLEQIAPEQSLLSVIASAMGYVFQGPHEQAKQFLHYLRNRQLLLILDNFEHLLHYSDFLLEILHYAPAIKIMVTSRTRLEFFGEWLIAIEGLPYPLPDLSLAGQHNHPAYAVSWHEYPAINLFVLTAQAIVPTFRADQEQEYIIAICQALDGLPLGIQLAAAAVYHHRCQEIAVSIQRNLDFINSNMRDLPERHRSLRAVFVHSWSLLSTLEQNAFASLAVFVNGFWEEQAAAIAEVEPEILVALSTKSLIQPLDEMSQERDPIVLPMQIGHRYQMHPVLHQFAAEELAKDAESERVCRQRHALYFCNFATKQYEQLGGSQAAEASAAWAREIENVRGAWHYALNHYRVDLLYNMLPGLVRFYLLRGFLQDARTFLASSIAQAERWFAENEEQFHHEDNVQKWQRLMAHLHAHEAEVEIELGGYEAAILAAQAAIEGAKAANDPHGQAMGSLQWGIALNHQGLYKQAKERLQHCLTLAQVDDMVQVEAAAHRYLGINSFYQGDYTAGRLHHEMAIRLYQENDDLVDELRTFHSLAMLYFYTGDYSQARQHYERCRQAYQQIGDRPTLSLTLNNLGAVSFHLGDYPNALRFFEEALVIRCQIGDRQMEGLILANMGLLAHLMNKNRQALDHCSQALEVSLEIGERDTEAYARTCLGHALLELGRVAEATVNYEQAIEIRRNNGQLTQVLEPLAGLARVKLRLGEIQQAATYVAEILPHLHVHTYAGIVELVRIYLTCYRVLFLQEDANAKEILTMGYTILQERAAKIADNQLRQGYLENIIAHRELLTEYETQM